MTVWDGVLSTSSGVCALCIQKMSRKQCHILLQGTHKADQLNDRLDMHRSVLVTCALTAARTFVATLGLLQEEK